MRQSRHDRPAAAFPALGGVVAFATVVAAGLFFAVPQPARREAGPAVVGNGVCAICHRVEVDSFARTANIHGQSITRLRSVHAERFKKIRAGLEDSEKWGAAASCNECHGMTVTTWSGGRAVDEVAGVGCESCHGAAGEEGGRPAEGRPAGWLNPHSRYGIGVLRRAEESAAHKKMRRARARTAGMLTATGAGAYDIAKRCYACHFVGDDELLDDGGHRVGNAADLEFVTWGMGWGRHNFFVSADSPDVAPSNAEVSGLAVAEAGGDMGAAVRSRKRTLYLVGQLARLEIGLRTLVGTKEGSAFDNAWDQLVEPAMEILGELAEEEDIIAACPRIKTVWDAIEDAEDWKDEIEEAESAKALAAAADTVAREGRALAREGVSAGDALENIDERMDESQVKGEPWQPR